MTINGSEINSVEINGYNVIATLSGTLGYFEQKVRTQLNGTLGYFEQEVQLRETLSGTLGYFEQTVQGSVSGTLGYFEQTVRDLSALGRDYDAQVLIGGQLISRGEYIRDFTITFNEDSTAIADVRIAPPAGVQDISFYYGKEIVINASFGSGPMQRIYTGIVDTCSFDVIDSITTLKCTNRRQELLESVPASAVQLSTNISLISGTFNSNYQEIQERLQYVPYSIEFDSYNQWHYVSWEPKATADYTITGSDIFRRDPRVDVVNRGRIINKVVVTANYSYKRLHNVKVNMTVDADQDDWSNTLATGKTLLSRATVIAVSESGVWKRGGAISFEALPAPGWYGGRAWVGDSAIVSTTNTGTSSTSGSTRTSTPLAEYNATRAHCLSATWSIYNRWVQEIQETYTFTIQSPTSQTLFGVVAKKDSYSISDSYDPTLWTDDTRYTGTFTTSTGQTINLSTSGSADVKKDLGLVTSNLQSAIQKAKTDILRTHRENTVICQIDLMPEIQLYHTVEINSDQIQAKGKVSRYTHTIKNSDDDAFTELEIKFYSLGAGGSDTSISLPSISTPSYGSYPTARAFGAFYGVPPASNPDNVRPGWYGNTFKSGVYTTIVPQLIVDYPAITGNLTDGANYSGSSSYNVAIPSDTLVVDYDEI